MRRATLAAGAAAIGAAGLGALYGATHWPLMSTWGATPLETTEPMPGDELVANPWYRSTRALDIAAPPDQVWAWLVQLGQDRGGMYSYDWLENLLGLHIHSADRIVPELQILAVGDLIRLAPAGREPDLTFRVAQLEAPSLLVLAPDGSREEALATGLPYAVWTFRLLPDDGSRTRLLVRFLAEFPRTVMGRASRVALEPVHFLMERKMMLTLKERAERWDQRSVSSSPAT